MIDAISSPAMAIDIRLSTLEPVQQLGARLAHILSGELSRMRSDVAFATAAGQLPHSSNSDAEGLRAQQSAMLGFQKLSLTTQTALYAESAVRFDADYAAMHQEQQLLEDDSNVDEDTIPADLLSPEFIAAIRKALSRLQATAQEAGFSGTPLALVMPAQHWLTQLSPGHLWSSSGRVDSGLDAGVLIICQAFDGDLAKNHPVWGFIYQKTHCISVALGHWTLEHISYDHDQWCVTVEEPSAMVSHLNCQMITSIDNQVSVPGLCIQASECSGEFNNWYWHMNSWKWI